MAPLGSKFPASTVVEAKSLVFGAFDFVPSVVSKACRVLWTPNPAHQVPPQPLEPTWKTFQYRRVNLQSARKPPGSSYQRSKMPLYASLLKLMTILSACSSFTKYGTHRTAGCPKSLSKLNCSGCSSRIRICWSMWTNTYRCSHVSSKLARTQPYRKSMKLLCFRLH